MANTVSFQITQLLSSRMLVSFLFISVLLATLTAGLWPFQAPANDATWVPRDSAVRFNQKGTAISNGMLRFGGVDRGPCTLELWLKPVSTWGGGVAADFYNRDRNREFAISQDGPDLLLQQIELGNRGTQREHVLEVRDVFRRSEVLLTLASDGNKTVVYLDGELIQDAPDFPLSSEELTAQLILGNAPRRSRGWPGEVKGIAIYDIGLSAVEVREHARQWIAFGRPVISAAQNVVALYLFRTPWASVIPNEVPGGPALLIPEKFQTLDQLRFESAASEAHFDDSYRDSAILNVLGFIPLGGVGAWFWSMFLRRQRAVFGAVITGMITSFAIEYFQSYLPTRYSGTTDLITNSFGTCLGVAIYLAVRWLATKRKRVGQEAAQPV